MNAVLGISRLLADTNLSLEQQQYVTMITNSGHLLLTIINDILDFSKIEAGQLRLSRGAHNVNDVIETAVMLTYEMAQSKGLHLSWFVDPSIPPSLLVDSTRLQQILLNLLSNGAVKSKHQLKEEDQFHSLNNPFCIYLNLLSMLSYACVCVHVFVFPYLFSHQVQSLFWLCQSQCDW